jgi:lipid-A-disaccharide synthase
LGACVGVTITDETILQTFQKVDFGIVASGTASLECAVTTKPLIVIYKTSWLSWLITKQFVKIPFACIANILAGEKIIPELLQKDFTVTGLTRHVDEICWGYDREKQKNYKHKINNILDLLGDGDSYKKTAEYIINYERGGEQKEAERLLC